LGGILKFLEKSDENCGNKLKKTKMADFGVGYISSL
jgi:hypothetical protein